MIFHQLFYPQAHAFTYLIAGRPGGEAVIVDPVLEAVEDYLRLVDRLSLKLRLSIDTHLHADHVTGAASLSAETGCGIAMGRESSAAPLDCPLVEGERLSFEGFAIDPLHTPGHTPDSYCLRVEGRLLTGDTLLINATGRTDLHGGDAEVQFRSLHAKLLSLPDDTLIYPGHDYFGATLSTIGHERRHNPRLSDGDAGSYAARMAALDLPPPRAMRHAIPANLKLGRLH